MECMSLQLNLTSGTCVCPSFGLQWFLKLVVFALCGVFYVSKSTVQVEAPIIVRHNGKTGKL